MKLKEAIDILYDLKQKRQELEKKEKELKEKIKKAVESGKLKIGEYRGERGYLKVIEQISLEYDTEKIAKTIGLDNYVKYSKPKITDIKKDFGEKVLSKAIIGEKKVIKLEVK